MFPKDLMHDQDGEGFFLNSVFIENNLAPNRTHRVLFRY